MLSKADTAQLRDAEQEPPRGEGVVPLPCEASREGEGAQAPQGVLTHLAVFPGIEQRVIRNRLALGLFIGQLLPWRLLVAEPLGRVALGVELGRAVRHAGTLQARSEEHTSELQS